MVVGRARIRPASSTIWFVSCPFSGLLAGLAVGSSVVCTPGFDASAFFGWLTEFRPTWYTAVPAIHRALLSTASYQKHRPQALKRSCAAVIWVRRRNTAYR